MGDGPPGFPRDCTCPAVLGNCLQEESVISSTGLSPSVVTLSRGLRLSPTLITSRAKPQDSPTTPVLSLEPVWAPPCSLAATGGISDLISTPAGTEMFHFPAFASSRLCIQREMTPYYGRRVSPFGHLRIKACSAAPRSLSQLATSFIARLRQGIHRVPLVA